MRSPVFLERFEPDATKDEIELLRDALVNTIGTLMKMDRDLRKLLAEGYFD